jgi:hypothetical protein
VLTCTETPIWWRRTTRCSTARSDPNGTGPDDVQELRDAGFDDRQVFGITLYVALRIAFSTVNDALGARPDRELAVAAPAPCARRSATAARSPAPDPLPEGPRTTRVEQ